MKMLLIWSLLGIYYSPALEYCAFDLAIAPRPSGVAKLDCRFLDYDYALPLFKVSDHPFLHSL